MDLIARNAEQETLERIFSSARSELVALYGAKKLRIDELVSKSYRLEDANQAMQDLRDGKNARGVIVFD